MRTGRPRNPNRVHPCRIDGCDKMTGRPGTALGLCSAHYNRQRRHGDPLKGERKRRPYGGPCCVPGCDREARTRGCCRSHSQRLYRNGGDPFVYRRGRPWTPEDDARLLDLPLTERGRIVVSGYLADLADHLDRTPSACRSRLSLLRDRRARQAMDRLPTGGATPAGGDGGTNDGESYRTGGP